MRWFKRQPLIEFIADNELVEVVPEPTIAGKYMPEWFKGLKILTEERSDDKMPVPSAKRCLPMLDAMTAGYVMRTAADIHVVTNHDCSIIEAATKTGSIISAVEKHSWSQVRSEMWDKKIAKQEPLKFINYWGIKTRPGYSCLFQTLPNHLSKDFMCLSGIVDTDRYPKQVNFPAIWLTPNFDGTLKAGTPLVQVIPFKRDKFPKVITRAKTKAEYKLFEKLDRMQSTREHVYTRELREIR